jgi:succinate-semialdehyde dehydrogenase/glutarate-semialdehyde dehydrogenase
MTNDFLREACFIGGRWYATDQRFEVTNPASGDVVAQVSEGGAELTRQAIDAAQAALPGWRATPPAERARWLGRLLAAIQAGREQLAMLLTTEQGKPLGEAIGEIDYAASYVEWFAGEAPRIYGETIPATNSKQRIVVTRQPIGVCAAITPWNFPSAMLARKIAPALAAGCTIVCKPAEQTPLSGLAWGVLAERIGLPPGVLNIVTGEPEPIGTELLASETVRKLSFTGSTEVGQLLMRGSAQTLKKLSLELGGNAPFVVFEDADIDKAVAGAIASKYRNSGQTCVCANRFLVQRSVAEEFTERLAQRSEQLVVGDGANPGTDIGPLIDRAASEKVADIVADALAGGATIVSGEQPAADSPWCKPTVLSGITRTMRAYREEIFGPIAAVMAFDSERDAIEAANDTNAGLAAYIYTRDGSRMYRVSEALEFGMVGVNTGAISAAQAPFGGIKHSGFGREGSHHGMDEYQVLKYTCIQVDE